MKRCHSLLQRSVGRLSHQKWVSTIKYSTQQQAPKEPPMVTPLLNQFEQNAENNTAKNVAFGLLICLTGLGIGFFGTGKAIFDYFGPAEEEAQDEKKETESSPLDNISARFASFADKEIDGVKYMTRLSHWPL